MKFEDDPTVKRWISKVLSRRTRSEGTAKIYIWHLKKFCEWSQKTPQQLILEHTEDLKSNDESVKSRHEELVTQYFAHLESVKKLSRNTALTAHAALRSFYKANYAPLNLETPEGWPTRQDHVPTREEISRMIGFADNPLEAALIAFSAQSGQRISVITSLRYGMVKEALTSKGPGAIHVPADLKDHRGKLINKHRQAYTFFIGEDAKRLLSEYLKRRKTLSENDLVFVSPRKFGGKEVALDDDAVNRILKRVAKRAGLSHSVANGMHHHLFRKFFQTAMEEAGVPSTWYEQLMGHMLPKTQRAYSKPTHEQLKEAYSRAESRLSLLIPETGQADAEETVRLLVWRENVRILGLNPAELRSKLASQLGREPTVDEEINYYSEQLAKTRVSSPVNPSEAKKTERKIVDLSQLESLIEEGWEPVMEMSNGKVVVRRET
ncbi:MAG: tyrosine-type recombinase/integrase [Thermoprotei archaeon]